jgi:EC042_2821-lke REase
LLAQEWFQIDLSQYNFFLMPLSFYHGFETVEPAADANYPAQVKKLLDFLSSLESHNNDEESRQHVALRLETKLVRGKDESAAVSFRWTDNPTAPAVAIREEDVLKNYPLSYRDLANTMKRRYEDFLENREFHHLRKTLEAEQKFAIVRILNPKSPHSARQRFYNPNILQEFDNHYKRRRK